MALQKKAKKKKEVDQKGHKNESSFLNLNLSLGHKSKEDIL